VDRVTDLFTLWKAGAITPNDLTAEERRDVWMLVLDEAIHTSQQLRQKVVPLVKKTMRKKTTMEKPAPLDIESLEQALERLLNTYSQENASNTPDFILAQYLLGCLDTWNAAIQRREEWYGREFKAGTVGQDPYAKDTTTGIVATPAATHRAATRR
jgi:hypothetical protein